MSKTVAPFQHTLKEIDVTISARGGDTQTKGKRCVWVCSRGPRAASFPSHPKPVSLTRRVPPCG